ncbi:protein lethal(2)essential for life-like [Actinia tenebrosa]|uniref:Protein lethal(2)essential for life-like n=1 Tax=Actinia tenebrosa TaxID=6105 RepID=A0A6P8HIA3_ACTTE|nr:protein lethal(2)essential for life-like [Actinia tenebrosa]
MYRGDKLVLATLGAFGHPFLGWTRYSDFKQEKDKVLLANLDVHNYEPNEITLKVEDGKVKVQGKHHSQGRFGFESSEFHQAYPLPEDVDPSSVSSRFSPDGVLYIEAYKKPKEKKAEAGPVAQMDDKKFSVNLDLSSFSPEEVKVKVFNNELMVNASKNTKSEEEGVFVSRQLHRHFVLPKDVDMDSIKSNLDKDGHLHIEATRKQLPEPTEREIEVVKPPKDEE